MHLALKYCQVTELKNGCHSNIDRTKVRDTKANAIVCCTKTRKRSATALKEKVIEIHMTYSGLVYASFEKKGQIGMIVPVC